MALFQQMLTVEAMSLVLQAIQTMAVVYACYQMRHLQWFFEMVLWWLSQLWEKLSITERRHMDRDCRPHEAQRQAQQILQEWDQAQDDQWCRRHLSHYRQVIIAKILSLHLQFDQRLWRGIMSKAIRQVEADMALMTPQELVINTG